MVKAIINGVVENLNEEIIFQFATINLYSKQDKYNCLFTNKFNHTPLAYIFIQRYQTIFYGQIPL